MSQQNKQDEHAQVEDHIIRRYELHEYKGKGAYGIVWKAIDKKTKQVVALKKVFDAFQNSTDAQRTYREVVFLQQLTDHENIVRLQSVIRSDNNRDLYMVFEFMETDLHKVIRANLLNQLHKQYIIYQLLKCLKYVHSGDLIHRDLKPSNLLIDSECQVKVADFGLARSISQAENEESNYISLFILLIKGNPVMTEYVATRWYRAPEILFGSHEYTKTVDMWSVGCILGEMIIGRAIFSGTSTINQIEKVIELLGRPKQDDLDAIQAPLASQVLQTITTTKRKSFAQFFTGASDEALDFLRNLLAFNPYKRMTVEEALSHQFMREFKGTEDEKVMKGTITIPFNDNKKFTIKDYREALYSGSTSKLPQPVTLSLFINIKKSQINNLMKERSASRVQGQSQSFHTEPASQDSDLQKRQMKEDIIQKGSSAMGTYQKQKTSTKQSSKEASQMSYNNMDVSVEEIPTVHKSYANKAMDSQQPTANNEQAYIRLNKTQTQDDVQKDQNEEIKKYNNLLAENHYFNHFVSSKTQNSITKQHSSSNNKSTSNTFLVQRTSKSNLSYESQIKNQNPYAPKTPDQTNYSVSMKQSTQGSNTIASTNTPYRSKSYEKQSLIQKVGQTGSQTAAPMHQSNGVVKQQDSSFNSESKTASNAVRQKTSVDRQPKQNFSSSFVVRGNDRQQTQPNAATLPNNNNNFQSSLNSVQKLLAKCINPSHLISSTKKPSYTTHTYASQTPYQTKKQSTSFHNKSNSFVESSATKLSTTANAHSFNYNYFEKQLHQRNQSVKGSSKFR